MFQIDLVIMEGAGGKAFCAGGDIKSITESKGDPHQLDFFRHEYRTDHLTGTIKKPYVAIIDGIVMGGGKLNCQNLFNFASWAQTFILFKRSRKGHPARVPEEFDLFIH